MLKISNSLRHLVERMAECTERDNTAHKRLNEAVRFVVSQVEAVESLSGADDPLMVERAVARLRTLTEAATEKVEKAGRDAEKSFDAALREKVGLTPGPFGPEIRARLYDMKPADRMATIQGLIEAKDGSSLHAVLSAPAVLTGLSGEEAAKFRRQFYEVAAPELVKARSAYEELHDHAEAIVKAASRASLEYGSPRRLAKLEAADAAIKEAQGVAGE